MSELETVLVTRFSAMGDVALVVPVLRGILHDYPHVQIVMVTRKMFFPFFSNVDRVTLHEFEPKGKHKGVMGLWRLAQEINRSYKITAYADLHNVLRTKILAFFVHKNRYACIDKGRAEKKAFVRRKNKVRKILKHTTERYGDVFTSVGYTSRITAGEWLKPDQPSAEAEKVIKEIRQDKIVFSSIGIAPFAKHKTKMWPLERCRKLIEMLSATKKCKIYLIGAPGQEASLLQLIADTHPNVINLAGKYTLTDEINIMRELKLMITMDSGNMHIASLAGVKVVSIWGATHPDVGFAPLGDNQSTMIQADIADVNCRPCSVFGDVDCYRGDYACMQAITVERVYREVCLLLGVVLKDSVTEDPLG